MGATVLVASGLGRAPDGSSARVLRGPGEERRVRRSAGASGGPGTPHLLREFHQQAWAGLLGGAEALCRSHVLREGLAGEGGDAGLPAGKPLEAGRSAKCVKRSAGGGRAALGLHARSCQPNGNAPSGTEPRTTPLSGRSARPSRRCVFPPLPTGFPAGSPVARPSEARGQRSNANRATVCLAAERRHPGPAPRYTNSGSNSNQSARARQGARGHTVRKLSHVVERTYARTHAEPAGDDAQRDAGQETAAHHQLLT